MMYEDWLESLNRLENPARAGYILWWLVTLAKGGECLEVSVSYLGQISRVGASTVKRALADLESVGIIRRASGLKQSGNVANRYQLLAPWSIVSQPLVQKGRTLGPEPVADVSNLNQTWSNMDQHKEVDTSDTDNTENYLTSNRLEDLEQELSGLGINARKRHLLAIGAQQAGLTVAEVKQDLKQAVQRTLEGQTRHSRDLPQHPKPAEVLRISAAYAIGILEKRITGRT